MERNETLSVVSWIQNIKEIARSKDAMNESLEQMALMLFPEEWKPVGNLLIGQEVDTNYEARQKWLRNAEEIYNLALQDAEKDMFQTIFTILKEDYGFDTLDRVKFVMRYERMTGERIPDDWFEKGVMKTVKL